MDGWKGLQKGEKLTALRGSNRRSREKFPSGERSSPGLRQKEGVSFEP